MTDDTPYTLGGAGTCRQEIVNKTVVSEFQN